MTEPFYPDVGAGFKFMLFYFLRLGLLLLRRGGESSEGNHPVYKAVSDCVS